MKIIGEQELQTFSSTGELCDRTNFEIRQHKPCPVKDFMDLATRVAELQFSNPDYVLLFRGQNRSYFRRNSDDVQYTSLAPSLFRGDNEQNPSSTTLLSRFKRLNRAERCLLDAYSARGFENTERLERFQILRWSILQHYGVCRTPLLDVTQSLRIAASFASDGAEDEAIVFVLGVPNLSGAITASAEAGIQIIRLVSVCPPEALRPHLQEGYLLGEYPEMSGYEQKRNYSHMEIDFGRRLVAKFRFDPTSFWGASGYFPKIPHEALYPDRNDPLFRLAKVVMKNLLPEART